MASLITTNDRDESLSSKLQKLSKDPDDAWSKLKHKLKVEPLFYAIPTSPVPNNVVRFVCISDTHNRTEYLQHPVPPGDVLLHAGDFTQRGKANEAQNFDKWLGTLPHAHKVVIAGNHDLLLDPDAYPPHLPADPAEILTNAIYLHDSDTHVYGIKIYGSPWTPRHNAMAFNLPRGEPLRKKWSAIPSDTDILMTHGPPLGHGDLTDRKKRAGCVDLLATVQSRVKPKYHIFGHVHEGHGMTTDGKTIFINASTCDAKCKPTNKAIVFDIPLPGNVTKTSVVTTPP